jgi:hypothetical protein
MHERIDSENMLKDNYSMRKSFTTSTTERQKRLGFSFTSVGESQETSTTVDRTTKNTSNPFCKT